LSAAVGQDDIIIELLARQGPLRMRDLERWIRGSTATALRTLLRRLEARGRLTRSGRGKGTTYSLPSNDNGTSVSEREQFARIRDYAREYGGIRRRAAANLCKTNGLVAARLLKDLTHRRPGLRPSPRRGVYEWVE
jgi:DNA-binding transcriptional regulator PaaX